MNIGNNGGKLSDNGDVYLTANSYNCWLLSLIENFKEKIKISIYHMRIFKPILLILNYLHKRKIKILIYILFTRNKYERSK